MARVARRRTSPLSGLLAWDPFAWRHRVLGRRADPHPLEDILQVTDDRRLSCERAIRQLHKSDRYLSSRHPSRHRDSFELASSARTLSSWTMQLATQGCRAWPARASSVS